jgi:nitrogen regulatory protein PII
LRRAVITGISLAYQSPNAIEQQWLSSSAVLLILFRSWESVMKRIEAVITPWTLDTFKEAAPQLRISEFELVEVYCSGCETNERGKRVYCGLEFKGDFLPRLRVEFVMFDDDVQATLHQLLELVHPESIAVFRLDQEVRTISSANSDLKHSPPSGQRMGTPEASRAISQNSRQNGKPGAITPIHAAPIRH